MNSFVPRHLGPSALQSLYIHFPYCLYKCHYCDFNSYAVEKDAMPENRYIAALIKEIKLKANPRAQVKTVFFGGGTPSLMSSDSVQQILTELVQAFPFEANAEITLEANPGTITRDKMLAFRNAGITRLSIGVQSVSEKNLSRFGRIHTGEQALAALRDATTCGFKGVSADMIYGFPDQTVDEWERELDSVVKLGLDHMSCYALTAEEGTMYTRDLRQGKFNAPESDVAATMQQLTYDKLEQAGLPAYEISNFARPEQESQHNLGYWNYRNYVGLGAGAWGMGSSMVDGRWSMVFRTENFKIPDKYIEAIENNHEFFRQEIIDLPTSQKEFLMMGLRLAEGVGFDDYSHRFGNDLRKSHAAAINQASERGLVKITSTRLQPTRQGYLMNNELVGMFFV